MGYTGGKTILKDYLKPFRPPRAPKAVVRYEVGPGEQAQVDLAEVRYVDEQGQLHRLYVFVMVLSYSRMMFVEFVRRADIPAFLRGHVHAFEFFGGVPRRILYDRTKLAVFGVDANGQPVWQGGGRAADPGRVAVGPRRLPRQPQRREGHAGHHRPAQAPVCLPEGPLRGGPGRRRQADPGGAGAGGLRVHRGHAHAAGPGGAGRGGRLPRALPGGEPDVAGQRGGPPGRASPPRPAALRPSFTRVRVSSSTDTSPCTRTRLRPPAAGARRRPPASAAAAPPPGRPAASRRGWPPSPGQRSAGSR